MTEIYYPYEGAQAQFYIGDPIERKADVIVVSSDPLSARMLRLVQMAEGRGLVVSIRTPEQMRQTGALSVMYYDEMASYCPPLPVLPKQKWSPKIQQLIAQLNRAKAQRNKNLVRDLTRQLEALGWQS
jgi:hypothetical protein